jgi:hypothetical protein
MKFHLTHKQTVLVRNADYKGRPPVREGDEWKGEDATRARGGEDVGFRLWGQNGSGRTILIINCNEPHLVLRGGLGRLMDLFRQEISEINPWRIFAVTKDKPPRGLCYELQFSRVGNEYTLVDYYPVVFAQLQGLLGDETAGIAYD